MTNTAKSQEVIIERNLDGIYTRVCINGKWKNRCLTDQPWPNVEDFFRDRGHLISLEDHIHFLRQGRDHLCGKLSTLMASIGMLGSYPDVYKALSELPPALQESDLSKETAIELLMNAIKKLHSDIRYIGDTMDIVAMHVYEEEQGGVNENDT